MHFSMLIRALKWEQLMGQKDQGIFSIEKRFAINCALTMTLMWLIAMNYLKRLTALIYTYLNLTDY